MTGTMPFRLNEGTKQEGLEESAHVGPRLRGRQAAKRRTFHGCRTAHRSRARYSRRRTERRKV